MQSGSDYWPDVAPPVVTSPAQGATFTATLGFTASMKPYMSSNTTQASTDYEVWTGANGTGTLMYSSYGDTSFILKTVPPSSFVAGTSYYFRCRFQGTGGRYSAWSADLRLVGA